MKKVLLNVLAALCLFPCTMAIAQDYDNTPVAVSKEKVRMDGNLYYTHLVLEKQTIFSISKAYGVSIEEIYAANPSMNLESEGLKKNQIILIPVKSDIKLETVAEPADNKPEKVDDDYIEHIARWYETLGTVAYKYNIDVNVLMKYNNMSNQDLTTRQIVKVPQGKTLEKLIAETKDAEVEIVAKEPDKIEIPDKADAIEETETAEPEAVTLPVQPDTLTIEELEVKRTDSVKVSIVLPLGSNGNVNNSNFDFYSGALLAIRALESEGIHTELKVFDLNVSMPEKEDLEESNIILGPVSPEDIEQVKAIVPDRIAVISPLDPKGVNVARNLTGVIQAPSSTDAQNKDIIEWIQSDMMAGDKIILVQEKNLDPTSVAEFLAQSGLEYDILNYGILEGRDITKSLSGLMTETGVNRILIASEREAFANDVIRNINLMIFQKYQAVLYASSRMKNYETIEVENFHTANMHLSNSYYVDYSNEKVKSFLFTYRALCEAEPTPYAYQGYDTAYYFIKQYAQFGPAWMNFMEIAEGLQSNFRFEREENAGFCNTATRRVVYGPEYSIEIVN